MKPHKLKTNVNGARNAMNRYQPGSDMWWVKFYELRKLEEGDDSERGRSVKAQP